MSYFLLKGNDMALVIRKGISRYLFEKTDPYMHNVWLWDEIPEEMRLEESDGKRYRAFLVWKGTIVEYVTANSKLALAWKKFIKNPG